MKQIIDLLAQAKLNTSFEVAMRRARRRGLLALLHFVLLGNEYAVIGNRVFVIVTKPHTRIIGT